MSDPRDESQPGDSAATAIVVHEIQAEYLYMGQRFPGRPTKRQELHFEGGKPYDVLVIEDEQGRERHVWFDISAFFGKS